ncbi:MAG: hypothetical protein RhofKO_13430 [Rhodothermales bacterium]
MTDSLTIRVPAPYDFFASTRGHGWIALAPFVPTDDGFARTHRLKSGTVVRVTVRAEQQHDATLVLAELAPSLSAAEVAEVDAMLRHGLRLDENFADFYTRCEAHGGIYTDAIGKGRLVRSPSVFEDAFKTICTTNTTWWQTKTMVARTVEHLGPAHADGSRCFPTVDVVRGAGVAFFKEVVRAGYRSEALVALAERADELEALHDGSLPTAEVRKRLLSFRGIGPYAAATMLMLLGRYDALAIDSEVRAFVGRTYCDGRHPSDAEIRSVYTDWGRWRYLAYIQDRQAREG